MSGIFVGNALAGNGDVAPPGWCDFEWKRWGAEALGS